MVQAPRPNAVAKNRAKMTLFSGGKKIIYVKLSSDEEVFIGDGVPTELIGKQVRTLTNDSDLEEVVLKGEAVKDRRTARRKRKKNLPNISDISLPSSSVFDFGQILLPHRPLVPELVQTDRCQWLDQAIQNPLVLRPEGAGGGVLVDDSGGHAEEDGPAEEGGVRQMNN